MISQMNLMTIRKKLLLIGLAVYAVASLLSMATMSLGAAFFMLMALASDGGPRGFLRHLREEIRKPASRWYFFIALFLTAACALSLVMAALFPLQYGGQGPEVHFWKDMAKAWYLFWPLFVAVGLGRLDDRGRRIVLKTWLIAFAFVCLVGLTQFYTGWPRPQWIPGTNPPRYHATAFLGHHLSAANILIFPFFVALALAWGRFRERWFVSLLVVLGFICLIASASRALWLALPVGILAWVVWSLPKKWKFVSAAVIVIVTGVALQLPVVQSRFSDSFGFVTRKDLWSANFQFFKARPLTGTGWHHNLELTGYYMEDQFVRAGGVPGSKAFFTGHAHNNVLEMMASTGALGLLAWIGWCGFTFCLLWRLSRRQELSWEHRKMSRALFCAWIVFQINGLTQVNFWESKVLHQIMWVTAWALVWASLKGTAREKTS